MVRSAPRARDTKFGSVSADEDDQDQDADDEEKYNTDEVVDDMGEKLPARMKVRRPIMPNWSTTMFAGMFVTKPDKRQR